MRIVAEEVDGSYYVDVILEPEEATQLLNGHVLESVALIKIKRFYIGIRVGDKWIYDENQHGFLQVEGE